MISHNLLIRHLFQIPFCLILNLSQLQMLFIFLPQKHIITLTLQQSNLYMEPNSFISPQLKEYLTQKAIRVELHHNGSTLNDISALNQANLIKNQCKALKSLLFMNIETSVFCTPKITNIAKIITQIQGLTHLNIDSNSEPDIKMFSNLKNLEKLELSSITYSWDPEFLQKNFPALKSVSGLRTLSHLSNLKAINQLQELKFNEVFFDSENMRAIVNQFPYLTSVGFDSCYLDDFHLEILAANIIELKAVAIGGNKVSGKGLRCLKRHANTLEQLQISSNKAIVSGDIIFVTRTFSHLKHLQISSSSLIPSLLDLPPTLSSLETFEIFEHSQKVLLQDINKILSCSKKLKQLKLTCQHNDSTGKTIQQSMKKLEVLRLWSNTGTRMWNCGMWNSGAFYISKIKSLKVIDFYANNLSGIGVMKVARNTDKANLYFARNLDLRKRTKRNIGLMRWSKHLVIKIQ